MISLFAALLAAPQPARQIKHQSQSWFSINTTAHVNDHWSLLADGHIRRHHFLGRSNFEFGRVGIQYHIDKKLSVAAGYGHLWLHPSTPGWSTVAHENRIYQQVMLLSTFRAIGIMQRFRNEQRWQQKIINDKFSGDHRFTNRFRYLLGFNIPVFKSNKLPVISIADEILLQAGREVGHSPFDQNRFFAGIRQQITKGLCFDSGYMIVYQQKLTGYQYDLNRTFRLFLYYNPSLHKNRSVSTGAIRKSPLRWPV